MFSSEIIAPSWSREGGLSAKEITEMMFDPTATPKQVEMMQEKLRSLPYARQKEIKAATDKLFKKLMKESQTPSLAEVVGGMKLYLGDWFFTLGGDYELTDTGGLLVYGSVTLPRNIITVADAKVVADALTTMIITAGTVNHNMITPWQNKNHKRTNARATVNENLACKDTHAADYAVFEAAGIVDGTLEYYDGRPTYKDYWSKLTADALATLTAGGIPTKRAKELSTAITTIAKSNFKK